MKLDFLIPGSATPAFYSQIAFFRLCLDRLGNDYRNSRIVAVFGDHEKEEISYEWRRHFDRIEVEWAHRPGEPNPMYRRQHDRRFECIRADADLAILCDADVALVRRFDSLVDRLRERPALAGVNAHFHFTLPGEQALPPNERRPIEDWPQIAKAVLGKPIDMPYTYTLMKPGPQNRAPFYINYGVFCGPPDLLREFYMHDLVMRERAEAILGQWWSAQVSVTLTIADLNLPHTTLPMRYNFPNDPAADKMHANELEHSVFLHYLRTRHFDRQLIFAESDDFDRFISTPMTGSNEVFRNLVRDVTGAVYPFGV